MSNGMSEAAAVRISVVLPTHNRLHLLQRSLASVLSQTFESIEVIVVDNACDDGTSEFLKKLGDPRVRLIRLDRKLGAAAARNAALAIVRAELIAFQDDDDIWLPHKLEKQMQALTAAPANTGLCLCGYVRLQGDVAEPVFDRSFFDQMDFRHGVILRNFSAVTTPGWLVRKSCLDKVGFFDEALPARNDWELALRLRDVCDFIFVSEPLFLQDQSRATSMRRNPAAYSTAVKRIIAVHGHRWADRPRVRASHAEIIGRYETTMGDPATGRHWLLQSLRDHPFQPRLLALYLLSLCGRRQLQGVRNLLRSLRGLKPGA